MAYETLLVDISEGIATVTVNRPSALNAMTLTTIRELQDAVQGLGASPQVRVVILTGAGGKAFVAGADIAGMRDMEPAEARDMCLLAHRTFTAIEASPKPFIAAVNGYALGGGCELAMCCDIRIAAQSARFGQPEINLGIIPGFGGTQRLPRLIGKGRALEMILTGEMIDAQEAYRIGLVNRVVPADELMATVQGMAARMAAKGLPALRACKEAVSTGLELDLASALTCEAGLFGLCFATADQKEGMSAFLEKRAATFTDR